MTKKITPPGFKPLDWKKIKEDSDTAALKEGSANKERKRKRASQRGESSAAAKAFDESCNAGSRYAKGDYMTDEVRFLSMEDIEKIRAAQDAVQEKEAQKKAPAKKQSPCAPGTKEETHEPLKDMCAKEAPLPDPNMEGSLEVQATLAKIMHDGHNKAARAKSGQKETVPTTTVPNLSIDSDHAFAKHVGTAHPYRQIHLRVHGPREKIRKALTHLPVDCVRTFPHSDKVCARQPSLDCHACGGLGFHFEDQVPEVLIKDFVYHRDLALREANCALRQRQITPEQFHEKMVQSYGKDCMGNCSKCTKRGSVDEACPICAGTNRIYAINEDELERVTLLAKRVAWDDRDCPPVCIDGVHWKSLRPNATLGINDFQHLPSLQVADGLAPSLRELADAQAEREGREVPLGEPEKEISEVFGETALRIARESFNTDLRNGGMDVKNLPRPEPSNRKRFFYNSWVPLALKTPQDSHSIAEFRADAPGQKHRYCVPPTETQCDLNFMLRMTMKAVEHIDVVTCPEADCQSTLCNMLCQTCGGLGVYCVSEAPTQVPLVKEIKRLIHEFVKERAVALNRVRGTFMCEMVPLPQKEAPVSEDLTGMDWCPRKKDSETDKELRKADDRGKPEVRNCIIDGNMVFDGEDCVIKGTIRLPQGGNIEGCYILGDVAKKESPVTPEDLKGCESCDEVAEEEECGVGSLGCLDNRFFGEAKPDTLGWVAHCSGRLFDAKQHVIDAEREYQESLNLHREQMLNDNPDLARWAYQNYKRMPGWMTSTWWGMFIFPALSFGLLGASIASGDHLSLPLFLVGVSLLYAIVSHRDATRNLFCEFEKRDESLNDAYTQLQMVECGILPDSVKRDALGNWSGPVAPPTAENYKDTGYSAWESFDADEAMHDYDDSDSCDEDEDSDEEIDERAKYI